MVRLVQILSNWNERNLDAIRRTIFLAFLPISSYGFVFKFVFARIWLLSDLQKNPLNECLSSLMDLVNHSNPQVNHRTAEIEYR